MSALGEMGPGDILGRYELLLPIARGGMAAVWAARLKGSRGFQKVVAIKTILPDLIEDPRFDQMFLDEASLASRIHHPHVVEIHDLGEQDGVLYLVMEWVDGEPLSVVLKSAAKSGGMPLPIAVRIASQACAGLHAAHELRDESGALLGLVHRDVSPQNILIAFDGVVKVVDFGVAKATSRAGSTTVGQVKGKVAYMAPEQARGEEIDRRTDIFALGIALYLMTTGHHPFRGDNDAVTIQHICNPEPPIRPSRIVPGYPPALEAVVQKALAKNRTQRYATANDLLKDLGQALPESERVVTDEPVAAFMQGILQHRYEQRRTALKAANHLADERAAGRTGLPPIDFGSHSGFTPISSTSVKAHTATMASSGPPPPRPLAPDVEATEAITTKSATGETVVERPSAMPAGQRLRYVLIACGLIGVGGAVGIVVVDRARSRSAAERAASSGQDSALVAPSQNKVSLDSPSAGADKSCAPATERADSADAAAETAANTSGGGRGGALTGGRTPQSARGTSYTRPGPGRTSPTSSNENGRARPSAPSGTAEHDTAGTFLSPVRTPGF